MDIVKYIKDLFAGKKSGGEQDYTDVLDALKGLERDQSKLPQKPELPEAGKYERMEYVEPTDEEIASSAASSLESFRREGESSIDRDIKALYDKYSADKSAASESYRKTLASLKSAYDTAVEEAGNDALKRGLARSSIAAGTVAALRGSQAEKEAEAGQSYAALESELDGKIASLESERQKAMDDLNVSYTAKLSETIQKLKEERRQLKNEALKYNNSLTEKENDEALERQKAESELYGEALDQKKRENALMDDLTVAEREEQYRKVYDLLRDKLASMSAVDAYNEVRTNSIYRKFLSDAYYYKLYDEFGR